MWPRVLYACFVASRIAILCYFVIINIVILIIVIIVIITMLLANNNSKNTNSNNSLLYYSPLLKNTRVRHVVLDKWFPLRHNCVSDE